MAGVSAPGRSTRKPAAAKAKAKAAPAAPLAPAPSPADAGVVQAAAAPATATEAATPAEAGRGIEVVGPAVGRRRAGFAFGAEPTRIALADIDDEQFEAIMADPALAVTRIDLDAQ